MELKFRIIPILKIILPKFMTYHLEIDMAICSAILSDILCGKKTLTFYLAFYLTSIMALLWHSIWHSSAAAPPAGPCPWRAISCNWGCVTFCTAGRLHLERCRCPGNRCLVYCLGAMYVFDCEYIFRDVIACRNHCLLAEWSSCNTSADVRSK